MVEGDGTCGLPSSKLPAVEVGAAEVRQPHGAEWNKIEHRLFSCIAVNWRGKPLYSLAAIVSLIAATTTASGLRVRSEIDQGRYPKGVVISDEQMAKVNLCPHSFHGDWNYTLRPSTRN